MEPYTSAEYTDMILTLGAAGGNAAEAVRMYGEQYPNRRQPSRPTFLSVERRLREYGSVNPRAVDRGRLHDEQILDAEEDILDAIADDPSTSTRRLGARFGVSQASVWRILNRNGLYPYHHQPIHALTERDYRQRVDFCRWLLAQEMENNGFVAEVLFSDEAYFTRNGMVNLHNTHTWAAENPHATTTRGHQERFSINVWAGILGDHLIGPFMLPQRLTGNVYTRFLQEDLPTLLDDVPLRIRRQMWFMHDGAPAHFYRGTRDFLNVTYPDKWIGRGGPIAWPPRSPDLTPLDFYLWGHLKSRVYATQSNTRQELWQRVQEACREVRNTPGIFERVRQSLLRRAQACINEGGRNFEHLL